MNLAPSGQIPSYLQGNSWGGLQQQQKALPGMFDTSGIQQSYENQIGSNFDQGRALAAAAASRYANTAAQTGGSSQGAGFAQAQAMLPIYGQANALRSDLASKQLQARGQQATLGADIAGRIGQLQSARQGMLSDYMQGQQRLSQNQSQFNSDLDFRNRSLQQNQQQFNSSQGERSREFNVTSGQQGQMNRLNALQLAMKNGPNVNYRFNLNNQGIPMSPYDQQQQQGYQDQLGYYSGLRNNLLGMI